jgi:hypothetical protein
VRRKQSSRDCLIIEKAVTSAGMTRHGINFRGWFGWKKVYAVRVFSLVV